jgi:ABC-type antimicrobial peptide transport system permease subunit
MLGQVVLDPGQHFDLHTMKDNEVLINAAYAKKANLKIGDWIKVNNFAYQDGSLPPFNHQYKVVGFALKPNDLFSPNMFGKKTLPDINLYITDAEEEKYTRFFYETDNMKIHASNVPESVPLTYVLTRVKELEPGANAKFFKKLTDYQILKHDPELRQFTQLNFYTVYTILKIVSLVLIAISLIILILSVLFISYSLSKEIEIYKPQIFILKAMGYRSSSLAFIWWLRTLGILFVGF